MCENVDRKPRIGSIKPRVRARIGHIKTRDSETALRG